MKTNSNGAEVSAWGEGFHNMNILAASQNGVEGVPRNTKSIIE